MIIIVDDEEPAVSLTGLTLHVRDVERSREFYERIPGARLHSHRPGQFALFSIGGGLLGLLQLGRTGFHVELSTKDLDAAHARIREAGLEPAGPPSRRPWGERTFQLADPDGNLLEFDEA
jgi:catechol 2,3-dioxygenase-like lactoylglutathione lyase family enzyme